MAKSRSLLEGETPNDPAGGRAPAPGSEADQRGLPPGDVDDSAERIREAEQQRRNTGDPGTGRRPS